MGSREFSREWELDGNSTELSLSIQPLQLTFPALIPLVHNHQPNLPRYPKFMKQILAVLNKEIFKERWNEKEYFAWKTRRQLGKFRYIISFGMMEFGSWLFLWLTAVFLFFDCLDGKETTLNKVLALNMAICLVSGIPAGLWLWHSNEKLFKEYEANHFDSAS